VVFVHIYTDVDIDTDTDTDTKEMWHSLGYTIYIDTTQIQTDMLKERERHGIWGGYGQ